MNATYYKGDIVLVDEELRAVVLSDWPGKPECVVGYVEDRRTVWQTVNVERVELDPDQDDFAEFANLYVDTDFTLYPEGRTPPPALPRESQPFRRSQSAVNRWPGGRPGFAGLLREVREDKGLSQSRLAARAGYDHSYVSRLESDSRSPTRDAVIHLCEALGSTDFERDELLQSAGFNALNPTHAIAHESVIAEAYEVLADAAVPDDVKNDLRSAIQMAMRQAQRAVSGWAAAS